MTFTDHLTFGALLLCLISFYILVFHQKRVEEKYIQDIFKALLIASLALILKYLSHLVLTGNYEARILNDIFLAVAAGSFASAALSYFNMPRGTKTYETTESHAFWEFTDSPITGMLTMTVTVEYNRTNLSSEPAIGMKPAGFELYLWTLDYKIDGVYCAQSRDAFYGSGGSALFHKLPIIQKGPVFELDKNDPDHWPAILNPNESKWYRWQGSVEVPQTYWDILIGATQLVGKETFSVKNRVNDIDMVFILKPSGKKRNFITNLEDMEKRDLEIPVSVDKPFVSRCTVSWCPRKMIADEKAVLKYMAQKDY